MTTTTFCRSCGHAHTTIECPVVKRAALTVYFFPNGNTAAFAGGEQVPALQVPWLQLYVDHLTDATGVDPTEVEFRLPDGRFARIFRCDNERGWNWQVLP